MGDRVDESDRACGCCGGTGPLYMHGLCHPEAKTWAVLHTNGDLEIQCAECETEIIRFPKVAEPAKPGVAAGDRRVLPRES
ncbi:hypothetical protein LCGC14_1241940 [marine sediment metagenome]|uniref:Uncharacterized protein n=1 Tax=marine sediment metagenome TaxID=412755 RepID=A0A0F9LSS6_9ZZZZ